MFVTEAQVAEALTVPAAVGEVRRVLTAWPQRLVLAPRQRLVHGDMVLHVLPGIAVDPDEGPWSGAKSYTAREQGRRHIVVVHSPDEQSPHMVEAELLGAIRTGAVSAVATKAMHPEPRHVACIGAGLQAEYQIRAMAALGDLKSIRVTGRTLGRAAALADQLTAELEVPVYAMPTIGETVEGADVVCTITRSATPVLSVDDLAVGAHVNAVGSNALDRQEIDAAIVRRADIAVESREQTPLEAGDLAPVVEGGGLQWSDLPELGEVVSADHPFTRTAQFTLFESLGIGALDLALAALIIRCRLQE